jgi:hypothetical protein
MLTYCISGYNYTSGTIKTICGLIAGFAYWYFPIYNFPKAQGHHLCGYKQMELDGNEVSIFYPTTEFTNPVKYDVDKLTWKNINYTLQMFEERSSIWFYRLTVGVIKHLWM